MNQETAERLHSMLTEHVHFKEVQHLKGKNRYFFERFDESASLQIPKSPESKFLYTYSNEEEKDIPFWFQQIIQKCETHN